MLRLAQWRGLVASLITLACLAVLVSGVNLSELEQAAWKTDYAWLSLALGVGAATIVTKGLRWSILYPAWARPSAALAISGLAAGQVANWAVPWRLGEVLRVGLASTPEPELRGRSVAAGTGVLLVEKMLDAAMLLATVVILVVVVGAPSWLSITAVVTALVGFGAGIGIAIQLKRGSSPPHWIAATKVWLARRLPQSAARLLDNASSVSEGLSSWLTMKIVIVAVVWSLLSWGLGALINYMVFLSAGINPTPAIAAALAVLVAVYGAAVLPSLPGRLGVFQYACVIALAPFGIQVEQALVFSVGLYLVVYVPAIVIGLGSMFVLGRASPHPTHHPGRRLV
jgi:uncharacterized protein (TIRG00374 family)